MLVSFRVEIYAPITLLPIYSLVKLKMIYYILIPLALIISIASEGENPAFIKAAYRSQ